ncbi:MAG: TonB-dependent receptor [Rhodocyclales bacterium GT-UBC]|nr:MAG: TonB-dependent receptor [Rhodocyclales bacterium GT-UBC]
MLNPHPTRSRQKILAVLVANLLAGGLSQAADPVFELGTIQVTAKKPQVGEVGEEQVASVVSREEMKTFNRQNVADAVNLLSGVTVSNNSRNEKIIYLRGYDVRQAPLFIDGIPVYVPYDGYVDFNRFTTADLSAIQVVKGFSSVAYGPNALGGAINLISRKPRAALEGDFNIGFGTGNERHTSANLGTNQGMWYLQAGVSYSDADTFRMSSDYKPTSTENGGRRENAYYRDSKASFKFGLTPNATDEYAISYIKQDGEKGQPPSTDPTAARYWKWPYWNKESLYFVSKTALTQHESMKVRLYVDKFENEVDTYTNSSYATLKTSGSGSVSTGSSIYNDKTQGGSLTFETTRLPYNTLRLIGHYKQDKHEETDATNQLNTAYKDTLASLSAEDNIQLGEQWLLSLGFAHHELRPDSVFSRGNAYSLPAKQTANNAQAGLFYDLTTNTRFYATVAQKTRLPTLKDRYSARLNTYIENPGLQAEQSVNYEIGYQGSPWQGAKAEAAIFYSDIDDKIQTVYKPGTSSCSATARCQMQNVGQVHSSGFELGLRSPVTGWLDLGGNFTYLNMENVSSPNTKLTDVPRQKATFYALIRPFGQLEIVPFIESESARWASNTVRVGAHTTLNLKAAYKPMKGLTLEAGVTNLTDQNYALADGFPNPGRMWFGNLNYQF